MRCISCNVLLQAHEVKRKSKTTNDYLDMCDHCLGYIVNDVVLADGDDLTLEIEEYFESTDEPTDAEL